MDVTDITVALTLLTTMVMGATELVKRLFDKDWKAAAIIGVAALVGAAGGFAFEVVGWALGLVTGLSAAGIFSGVQNIGKSSRGLPDGQ